MEQIDTTVLNNGESVHLAEKINEIIVAITPEKAPEVAAPVVVAPPAAPAAPVAPVDPVPPVDPAAPDA